MFGSLTRRSFNARLLHSRDHCTDRALCHFTARKFSSSSLTQLLTHLDTLFTNHTMNLVYPTDRVAGYLRKRLVYRESDRNYYVLTPKNELRRVDDDETLQYFLGLSHMPFIEVHGQRYTRQNLSTVRASLYRLLNLPLVEQDPQLASLPRYIMQSFKDAQLYFVPHSGSAKKDFWLVRNFTRVAVVDPRNSSCCAHLTPIETSSRRIDWVPIHIQATPS